MEKILRPVVFEYLSVTSYLQDLYKFRKSNEKKFSYERWSQELGIGNRSFIRFVVTGKKKLSQKMLNQLAELVFSEEKEREYFAYLARFSQAKDGKEKDLYGRKLMEMVRNAVSPTHIPINSGLVSDPLLPQVLSVFGYSDLRVTRDSLRKIFPVEESLLDGAIELLEKMKLIAKHSDESGPFWISEVQSYWVPDGFGSLDLVRYHSTALKTALEAFSRPKEERRYKSLILPMTHDEFVAFNSLLDGFASEQISRLNTKSCAGKRVYQANFNVHSVSNEIVE